jgi:hypothetical protein
MFLKRSRGKTWYIWIGVDVFDQDHGWLKNLPIIYQYWIAGDLSLIQYPMKSPKIWYVTIIKYPLIPHETIIVDGYIPIFLIEIPYDHGKTNVPSGKLT